MAPHQSTGTLAAESGSAAQEKAAESPQVAAVEALIQGSTAYWGKDKVEADKPQQYAAHKVRPSSSPYMLCKVTCAITGSVEG